jgi:hypothetical protein
MLAPTDRITTDMAFSFDKKQGYVSTHEDTDLPKKVNTTKNEEMCPLKCVYYFDSVQESRLQGIPYVYTIYILTLYGHLLESTAGGSLDAVPIHCSRQASP